MKTNGENTASRAYLIIGSGRLARHFQHYFRLLQLPFLTWNRHQPTQDLELLLKDRPIVLLAISDQALSSFYDSHLGQHHLSVLHFSGAFSHSEMKSCHPLMTFNDEVYSLGTYQSVHFAVTGVHSVQDLIPELPNPSFELKESDKSLYHAWCVLSAAGTQTLWNAGLQQLKNLGMPEEAYFAYVKKITENFIANPQKSLTGPWVRNDQTTIQKNLQALSDTPAAQVYELLKKGQL